CARISYYDYEGVDYW
nr:immunoglobulin heavy chain junction region [Mus musculus]NSM06653.1 immunoglobulin heavy chain junction region [Mus musculus]NSM07701.1 immunoglobulin heavy chain junction region [Mus musculus]NSM08058.1 immunoglobulin heavy chain junction region [Mus musculus]NSM09197.1 immunoglobulin heavy chain junction region [Mus musculus]